MTKIFLTIFFLFTFINADYKIIEDENLFKVKIEKSEFKQDLLNLKDELIFNGFTIVYELNMAKSTNGVAKLLNEKGALENGINIGICKSSFTFEMVKENFHNINYCPLGISIYQEQKGTSYISYKKYKVLKQNDKIATKINEILKEMILNSLD